MMEDSENRRERLSFAVGVSITWGEEDACGGAVRVLERVGEADLGEEKIGLLLLTWELGSSPPQKCSCPARMAEG